MDRPPNPPAAVRKLVDIGLVFPIDKAALNSLVHYLHLLLTLRTPAANDAFVRTVHAIAQASARRIPRARELACAGGCALCCRAHVSVLAPEAFALARAARLVAAGEARVRALAAIIPETNVAARRRNGIGCSLLEDNLCSVYAARPLTCRMMASFSLRACEVAAMGGPDLVPQPGEFPNIRGFLALAAYAALAGAGLPLTAYELNQTLVQLFDDPGAEARYYAGGADFGVAMQADTLPPAFVAQIRKTAAEAGL